MTGTTRPAYAGTKPPRLADDSPGLLAQIGHGWAERDVAAPVDAAAARAAAAHRARLSAALPGRTIVIEAGWAPRRNGDANYAFRPDSDFVWATSCQVEGGVLVLTPRPGGHDAVLYLPPPARPGERDFYASPAHGELWVGPSAGLDAWSAALDLPVRPISRYAAPADPVDAGRVLSDLRMIKDDWEIAQLRAAVDATVHGFAAVAREVPHAIAENLGERWLQGTFDRYARTFGNGPGYSTIVGSGPHAPILHWVRCDGPILAGETLLLDMGVEATSLYTADVTRTLPVGGTFTPTQRAVHDLVEAAHRAGMAQVRPGAQYSDFHFASMEVLVHGLADWGLLPVSVDEALAPQGQQHRRFVVCGVGHHLGLDVHDCGVSEYEQYHGAPLAAGMVLTVEPGLYFHAHDETLPPEEQRWSASDYPGAGVAPTASLLRGHYAGHFLSMLALAYASTGDPAIRDKSDSMVAGLAEVQGALAATGRFSHPGFLAAYGEWQFARLEELAPYGEIWAPWYTCHKILAGLLHAYEHTGSKLALEVVTRMGHWAASRILRVDRAQR